MYQCVSVSVCVFAHIYNVCLGVSECVSLGVSACVRGLALGQRWAGSPRRVLFHQSPTLESSSRQRTSRIGRDNGEAARPRRQVPAE